MSGQATPLDRAHAAMVDAPCSDAARLRFFERLADAELFLLLDRPGTGDTISPRIFPLEHGPVVLAFDTEERLSAFAGAVPYVRFSGRTLAGLIAGRGIALGLNLDVGPSSQIVPPEAVDWLAATLAGEPEPRVARPAAFRSPGGLPHAVFAALDAKLPGLAGLARAACLAAVAYDDGSDGHIVGFLDPVPGAEEALARAVREALVFSGLEAVTLDVIALSPGDPMEQPLLSAGLRFDIPASASRGGAPRPPGMDPDRPPRLG